MQPLFAARALRPVLARLCLSAWLASTLAGCAGTQTSHSTAGSPSASGSGVTVYGTVDAGVGRVSR